MEPLSIAAAATEAEVRRIDPADFDWIVTRHQKQIYRILLCLVRDADAADTLTQECFLRAFQKHASFRGDASLATWLVRIAINMGRDHNKNRRWAFWRRLARANNLERIPTSDGRRSPEQSLMDSESLRLIFSAIEQLSEQQKTVFLLHIVEEMPLEEIAATLRLKLGTVKSHLFRARAAVRNRCATHR